MKGLRVAAMSARQHAPISLLLILPLFLDESLSASRRPDFSHLFALIAIELVGHPEQSAVDNCAIVIAQINDAGFNDKTAEFDQMSGALAALDLPSAHVIASQSRLQAIECRPVVLNRCEGCAEMPKQFAGTCSRKTSPHA